MRHWLIRELNQELIDAYLARRALDYLVGFSYRQCYGESYQAALGWLRSVSRVRLICEREAEIEIFKPKEYWTIISEFATGDDKKVPARLTHLQGKSSADMILQPKMGLREATEIERHNYQVTTVGERR